MKTSDMTESVDGGEFRTPSVPMADLFPYPAAHGLTAIEIADDDPQVLRLVWDDGTVVEWHALALRDSCACTDCRHPSSLERTVDQLSYPLDLTAASAEITAAGDLRIVWSHGGHVSVYQGGWLRAGGRPEAATSGEAPRPWGREFALPRFRFDAVMSDDDALLAWLEALRSTGLAYISEAPGEDGTVARLVRRIAHIRETNFGVVFRRQGARRHDLERLYGDRPAASRRPAVTRIPARLPVFALPAERCGGRPVSLRRRAAPGQ